MIDGPSKGRSAVYLAPGAKLATACPAHSAAPAAATELAQCQCVHGYFDNHSAINVVSCRPCGACGTDQFEVAACGAVNLAHGRDTTCGKCPPHSSLRRTPSIAPTTAPSPPPTSRTAPCTDTPDYEDSFGTCATYRDELWCALCI